MQNNPTQKPGGGGGESRIRWCSVESIKKIPATDDQKKKKKEGGVAKSGTKGPVTDLKKSGGG